MATPELALATAVTWNAAAITGITSVNGPTEKVDFVDTSNMLTTGGKKTFLPTLVDTGEVTIELLFDGDDTVHIALYVDMEAKTVRALVITETDPTPKVRTMATAYVQSFTWTRDYKEAVKATVVFKVSGAVTHA